MDYDHDGDLHPLLTGSPLGPGRRGERAVAQQRQWDVYRADGGDRIWRKRQDGGRDSERDFNNDRAVDVAITGDGPSPLIYVNPREGKYPTQPLYEDAKLPPSTGIAVLD